MRPVRCVLAILSKKRSGASFAMTLQTFMAKALAAFQSTSWACSGVTTCKPLPPVVLQKLTRLRVFQPISDFMRAGDHLFKRHVRRRVEVENQPAGLLRVKGLAIPGVHLQRVKLSPGDQRLHPVELQVGPGVPRHCDRIDQTGLPLAAMALEKAFLCAHPIRKADDRAWASANMRNHPRPDRLVILGEVELGHGLAVVSVRPQRLAGVGKRDVHDDGRAAGANRSRPGGVTAYRGWSLRADISMSSPSRQRHATHRS